RIWMVTLTYPRHWPTDPRSWKKHLDAWRKRMQRAWGRLPAVWKLEPQRRGAPHFHLLVVVPASWTATLYASGTLERKGRRITCWRGESLRRFRQWCSISWASVVRGKEKPEPTTTDEANHVKVGTNVEPMGSWERLTHYVSK